MQSLTQAVNAGHTAVPPAVPGMNASPGAASVLLARSEERRLREAFAFHTALADRWATASVERTTRDAGEPGVRLRYYLYLRQPLSPPGQTPRP
ncbi:DUF6207 family protein [Streptomyces sp. NPDC058818]|uniref:DUF6207 family protein n=1 Tax=Streptomyces sp. NPDC058818 TaxID=3346640 RepID=UPI003687F863